MYQGYVKLWRKSIEGGWLSNHKLWSFWCWCLMKATHREYDLIVGLQVVHLMPGDFVFGRKAAASELKMSEQEIRTAVDSMRKRQNLTIKSTNKFSIISIVNWDTYQSDENEINQQTNQPLTNKQPTTNHKQECKEHKNVKKTNIGIFSLPEWINQEAWDGYVEMRKSLRKPLTERAKNLAVSKLTGLRVKGYNPNSILQDATFNSWQGLYEPKENNNATSRTTGNNQGGSRLPEYKPNFDQNLSAEQRAANIASIKKITGGIG